MLCFFCTQFLTFLHWLVGRIFNVHILLSYPLQAFRCSVSSWSFTGVSHQVSSILRSIQANLNNTEVWIVSIFPLISNSCSLLSKLLGSILSAIIGITNTFMFCSVPSSITKSWYFVPFPFISFSLGASLKVNSHFWLIILRSDFMAELR